MNANRYKLSAAVYLLLIRDEQIFLLRRHNTGWADGQYTTVAGHLDANEPLTHAMCREASDEAGITILPRELRLTHVMHHKEASEYVLFFFKAASWQGLPHNAEPNKCDDARWFDLYNLPDKLLPHVKQAIQASQSGTMFSEVGWK